MSQTAGAFLSRYSQWVRHVVHPRSHSRIVSTLRKAIYDELPKRDGESLLATYTFRGIGELRLRYESQHLVVFAGGRRSGLRLAVVAPGWRNGWKEIAQDEDLGEQISWFFHFASQYVMRSYAVSALGAIALVYNQGIEVNRSSNGSWTGIEVAPSDVNLPEILRRRAGWRNLRSKRSTSSKEARVHSWIRTINGLDPYVHRALFLYIRAVNLLDQGFEEQAMTCLDCITAVASEFVRDVLGERDDQQRERTYRALHLTPDQAEMLRHLYAVRCYFGGHPSPTKWWDFRELYEQEIEQYATVSQLVIRKLCELERRHRRVDPRPTSWHAWFLKHSVMLWNAVGFDRLPS